DLKRLLFGPDANVDRDARNFIALARGFMKTGNGAVDDSRRMAREVRKAAAALLPDLDRVVRRYQLESEDRVNTLRRLERLTLVATLLTLLGSGVFIFRPMVARIRDFIAALAETEERFRSFTHSSNVPAMIT
ncbi:MAG: hypothetical protein HQL36_07770, partial [Alphaproteobacteria bacterium]|nr:hypothetical protein [Alphaproteobacteria bacterium]